MHYVELDPTVDHAPRVRELMVEEIRAHVETLDNPRLTPAGRAKLPELLELAAKGFGEGWLRLQLDAPGLLVEREPRRMPSGEEKLVKVPHTAAQTLAEAEFNSFYCRAVCRLALERGRAVEVYRAKPVSEPRERSQQILGRRLDPREALTDLRAGSVGGDMIFGVPGGWNSGISLRLA